MGGFRLGNSRSRSFGNLVSLSSTAALLLLSGPARAQVALSARSQPTAALVPVVTPVKGDDLFAAGSGPTASAAFTPLRLSLTGGVFPQARFFPGCDSRAEASGNTINGFATQYYSYVRLAPQLVLHGFSSLGCAVDAGMGGGVTYTVPLRKSLWLVPSAGFYAVPMAQGAGLTARVTAAASVDLVKQLGWGGTLSVGLGARFDSGALNAFHFGGSF